jgi:membrane-associated HD superfamily phosphohydrolase
MPDSSLLPASPVSSWPRWAFLGVCALLSVWCLWPDDPFPYDFEAGKPWAYADLVAPFDFEVQQSPERVAEATRQVEADFKPVFWVDGEVLRRQKKELSNAIAAQKKISANDAQYEDLVKNPNAYVAYGHRLLELVYTRGIVEPPLPTGQIIQIQTSTELRDTRSDSLFSKTNASALLSDSLPGSPLRQPELLLPILDKLLVVNVFQSDSFTQAEKKRRIDALVNTGQVVRQGELVIRRGTLLDDDALARLHSLRQHFSAPDSLRTFGGLLLFSLLAWALWAWCSAEWWLSSRRWWWVPLGALATLVVLAWCRTAGESVSLLLPLFLGPLLGRSFGWSERNAWGLWGLVVGLWGASLAWGGTWVGLQVAGALVATRLNPRVQTWGHRAAAVVAVVGVQVLVLAASALLGLLPGVLQTIDSVGFLALSGLLSLGQSLLVRFFRF